MPTSSGIWGAGEEKRKSAIDDEGWASGDTTTEPNYDGWGTLEKQPDPIASKRGWKAVFSRKSSRNIMNDIHCTKCKKSFSSTTQIDKHACEGAAENGDIMSKGGENTMSPLNSSNSMHSDKPQNSGEDETTGDEWGGVENMDAERNNKRRGIWSAEEDVFSYQYTIPEKNDVNNGQGGDRAYEEPFDQEISLTPPKRNNKPKRNVRTSPYKERFEALLVQGWLIPSEIELLHASEGRDLITHLRHFELVAPMRSVENTCLEPLENQTAIHEYPYSAVYVLLLQWEENDLGSEYFVNELMTVFKETFGFESAESFHIPQRRSYEALETRLQEFKQQYSSEQNLLIVYYSGHGYLDLQNRMHWAARSFFPCPTLHWYALQVGLERTTSDVLILLDACCSAGASNHVSELSSTQGGRTEMIVASGFDQTTSGHSFTAALVGELKRMAKADPNYKVCISAAQLHQRLLASMLHQSFPKENDPDVMITGIHRFSTPVYISLSRDHHKPSIPLKRFRTRLPLPSLVGSSIDKGPRPRRFDGKDIISTQEPPTVYAESNNPNSDSSEAGTVEVAVKSRGGLLTTK